MFSATVWVRFAVSAASTTVNNLSPWKAMGKSSFDVCVIGAGPAGIAAALRAVDYKRTVCLVEANRIGGVDLWNGTLQSKTMWDFATMLSRLKGSNAKRVYGESMEDYVELDEVKMRESINGVSTEREQQILTALEATKNVTLLFGQATFTNDHELQVNNRAKREYHKIDADYFIIATGSTPREHPFASVDGELVVTSEHIMHMPLPKRLVVVGAGAQGCEFATIFAGLGKTKVYLIDKAPHILPYEDSDVAAKVESQLESAGVTIHHDSILYDMQVCKSEVGPSTVQYTVLNKITKEITTVNVDRALISIGRNPFYRGLGLEHTNLKLVDGMLSVDNRGKCSSCPHIYAVGDAVSKQQLVSVAAARGKLAIDSIYGVNLNPVPDFKQTLAMVTFLTRSVSHVGFNEKYCREHNIAYFAARIGYENISRTVAADNTDGFLKLIVSHDGTYSILGVSAVGANSSTLVNIGSIAIQHGYTALDLSYMLTAYPAVSQAFQQCLLALTSDASYHAHHHKQSGDNGTKVTDGGVCQERQTDIYGLNVATPHSSNNNVKITSWTPPFFNRGCAYQQVEKTHFMQEEFLRKFAPD